MNKVVRRATPVSLLVAVSSASIFVGLGLGGCAPSRSPAPATQATGADAPVMELQVKDMRVGQGAEATAGARVTVHYTGWLFDPTAPEHKGKEFDSSRRGGEPFSFTIGARQVIAGWDQGVAGMRKGGQRRLVIPSSLAYGERGAGGVIPPNATLVFDVELLDVQPPRG